MNLNNLFHEFMFSMGYFIVFAILFYKKFYPNMAKIFNDLVVNNKKKLQENQYLLKNFQEESINLKKKIILMEEAVNKEKEMIPKAEKNCQLKLKTLIHKNTILNEDYKKNMIKFYKKSAMTEWVIKNKNEIFQKLKDLPLQPIKPMEENIVLNVKKLNKNILKKIDELWS